MAQHRTPLGTPPEDLGSLPSTYVVTHNLLYVILVSRELALLLDSLDICRQNMHTYKKTNFPAVYCVDR